MVRDNSFLTTDSHWWLYLSLTPLWRHWNGLKSVSQWSDGLCSHRSGGGGLRVLPLRHDRSIPSFPSRWWPLPGKHLPVRPSLQHHFLFLLCSVLGKALHLERQSWFWICGAWASFRGQSSAGWHRGERFTIRPACRHWFFVSMKSSEWVNVKINLLLLFSSPLVFAYYSSPAPEDGYSWLINVTAHSEFAVCALTTFLEAASTVFTNTFKNDTRLKPGVPYLIAPSALIIDLVDTIGACPIVDGSNYIMATLLMDGHTVKCVS